MKLTGKNTVITIEFYINSVKQQTEYFTSIRAVNSLINLLICAGYNEDDQATNYHQMWTRIDEDSKARQYVIHQHTGNFDCRLRDQI